MEFNLIDVFAPKDKYPPCGMFTPNHYILLLFGLTLFYLIIKLTKHWDENKVLKFTRNTTVVVIVLESTKIIFNFYNGYTWIDAWVPISFCSMFIYSLVLSSWGKGAAKKMGDAYISGSAFIAGVMFLLIPSTSLSQYPAWHYLCIYSIIFHVLMMSFNVIYIRNLKKSVDLKNYKFFLIFLSIFVVISLVINSVWGSNLMLIRQPFNIPIPIIQNIYDKSPLLYTTLSIACYAVVTYMLTSLVVKTNMKAKNESSISKLKKHKSN